ncbi:hypothetical protein FNYG_07131 [Fusarium nygamai]|uniref:Uncharacterized protein n=1 Tax=Gibberella nygamai TaxID=42673 RepID=A0A2K0WB49_GIBNY|nr:hypothetical protein FNYG_07131 [Fusarium nygamai]
MCRERKNQRRQRVTAIIGRHGNDPHVGSIVKKDIESPLDNSNQRHRT